jgi:uncharacterized membrane protein YedE/YeeE
LALRLSTLNSPAKVSSFLILPIPDPKLFDATLAFLAVGTLPLAALLYYLGARLQTPQRSTMENARPGGHNLAGSEREPLISPHQSRPPSRGSLPVLEGYAWPESPSSIIDKKLIVGSILFGIGWGMLGICRTSINLYTRRTIQLTVSLAGPAVLNFGTSIYSLIRAQSDLLLVERSVWLATFVAGGLAAP